MSLHPTGVSGYPRASAMGSGMAMTSGVSMNGSLSGAMAEPPSSVRRWFNTAPHALEAGDHTTGRGPSTSSSQPSYSNVVDAPEDLAWGRTNTHLPPTSASESLNV